MSAEVERTDLSVAEWATQCRPLADPAEKKVYLRRGIIVPDSVSGIAPGKIVEEAMPVAPSETSILQQYEDLGFVKSDKPFATQVDVGPEDFFTEAEIDVLNQQPIPYRFVEEAKGTGIPQFPGELAAYDNPDIVLQPRNGLPVMAAGFSSAKVKYEFLKGGIVSRDPILNNKEEILKFFNFHGMAPPNAFIVVEGYHYKTRTESVNGSNSTRRERCVDFYYNIDITGFIYPFGKVSMARNKKTAYKPVGLLLEEYLADRNMMKSLQLKKKLFWDANSLCKLVHRYIRELGWRNNLRVVHRVSNTSVRVAANYRLSRMYDSLDGRALMVITVIPAIMAKIYSHGHRKRILQSAFTIRYSPVQVFEMIRPQLWCPAKKPYFFT